MTTLPTHPQDQWLVPNNSMNTTVKMIATIKVCTLHTHPQEQQLLLLVPIGDINTIVNMFVIIVSS